MRINGKRFAAGLVILLLIFFVVGGTASVIGTSDRKPSPNPKPGGNEQVTFMVAGSGCDQVAVATQALLARGFTPEQFAIGDQINWSAPEANERGYGAFTDFTPTTAQAVTAELANPTEKARAALNALQAESGAPPEQLLDPANWVPIQFTVESTMDGNTAFRGGEAVPVGTRQSAAGDVVWLFVNPTECPAVQSGQLPPEEAVTAHRAGCGNPQTELPKPGPGVAQPTPQPTPERSVQPTPPPSGGKDHRLSPVSPDRNHPDERVRPVIPAPEVVIRPPGAQPTQPAPPVTVPTPPQVTAPEPVRPDVPNLPPTNVDPVEAPGADQDGDGIPD
jgi:hypothetical protein